MTKYAYELHTIQDLETRLADSAAIDRFVVAEMNKLGDSGLRIANVERLPNELSSTRMSTSGELIWFIRFSVLAERAIESE